MRLFFGRSVVAALFLLSAAGAVRANPFDTLELCILRQRISGKLLDYTHNHGRNNRVHSPALDQCRDLYVYLPPCYDPALKYPVIFYLHGFAQDERSFFVVVPELDRAIRDGRMPAAVVVAVDGSISGEANLLRGGDASFFVNSKAGKYEDYMMVDVWNWTHQNFSIRPEREAHVLTGASAGGGGAAFDLAIRYRDRIGAVAGIFPSLNLRYVDCHHNYRAKFNPCCVAWRTQLCDRNEVIARYFCGTVPIRMSSFVEPLYDWGPAALEQLSLHNPAEHIEREKLRNGDLAMYIGYGKRDEFNMDAQIESFLAIAQRNGIEVTTVCLPHGSHSLRTAVHLMPGTINWIGSKLQGYGPTP